MMNNLNVEKNIFINSNQELIFNKLYNNPFWSFLDKSNNI